MVNDLNRWLGRRFDNCHISVSEAVKQEIMTNLFRHQEHKVIYNSLPVSFWNDKAEEHWQQVRQVIRSVAGRYLVLIPNRIDYNKGQLFFLQVLGNFLHTSGGAFADIAVFVVGDGPQRRELELQVQSMGLSDIVKITGALPNAVVQKFMLEVQLVVVPSYCEGFSLSALEAISSKCLLLASDTGGLKEVVRDGDTGFLFRTGDKKDCLEKLTYLYHNRHKVLLNYQLMEDDLKNKFSVKRHINQLLEVLEV